MMSYKNLIYLKPLLLRRKNHHLDLLRPPKRAPCPPKSSNSRVLLSPPKTPLLAPRPSALHIQAAITLSELGEGRGAPKADIGTQTSEGASPRGRGSCSPGRAWRKVSAETQTRSRGARKRGPTVSSQV